MSDSPRIRKPYLPFRVRSKRVPTKREFTFTRTWVTSESPVGQHAEVTDMLDGRGKIIKVTELPSGKRLSQSVSESPVPLIITSPTPQVVHLGEDGDSEEESLEPRSSPKQESGGSTPISVPQSVSGSITEHNNVEHNVVLQVHDGQIQPQTQPRKKNRSFAVRSADDSDDSENEAIGEGQLPFDDKIEGGFFPNMHVPVTNLNRISEVPSFRMQRHSTPIREVSARPLHDSNVRTPAENSTSKSPGTSALQRKSLRLDKSRSFELPQLEITEAKDRHEIKTTSGPTKQQSSLSKIPSRQSPRLRDSTSLRELVNSPAPPTDNQHIARPPTMQQSGPNKISSRQSPRLRESTSPPASVNSPVPSSDKQHLPSSLKGKSVRRSSSPVKSPVVSVPHRPPDEAQVTPTNSRKSQATEHKRSLFPASAVIPSKQKKSLSANKSRRKSSVQSTLDPFVFATLADPPESARHSRLAAAEVPETPVVAQTMPCDISVWQDGSSRRALSHLTDLDIVMNHLDETAWEIKERTVDRFHRKAIKRFMRKTDTDIQQTISDSHSLLTLTASVSKSAATVRRNRKTLLAAQEINAELRAEIKKLKRLHRKVDEPDRDLKELHGISAFLSQLTDMQHKLRSTEMPKQLSKKMVVYGCPSELSVSSNDSTSVRRRLVLRT